MALLVLASAVPTALRALLVLRVSTWACLLCFTTYTERVGICRMFAGVQEPRIAQCEEAFTAAFQGLSDMEINYEERSRLHDTFTQMTLSLQEEAVARGSFEVAFPAAAEKMKRAILQLKKVQPCIPPCGRGRSPGPGPRLQGSRKPPGASTAAGATPPCATCRWTVQDVTVGRGDQAMFSCVVGFPLAEEEIAYSWSFAGGGLRTRDASYFRGMPRARGYLVRIRPVQPTHRGTFSCMILHDQRPLARLYFFLNGHSSDGI
ncbi:sperm acrosome membrane-associated protein 6 isoform X5 [Heterocephalus glaber]|uniref:Sperm acrosome membrane-associated protein 6 isoform X5 n=1 Tax=Heterocephalus glaber TaxID=10181 RepID=A0AAX6S2W2_HETGA|nr:sperm acrosome membrane-associated protein 6 isoform X5 [Heterocephalus glaber]